MKRWFDALPIHRKLVAMALLVTTTALLAAMTGLIAVDVWRSRAAAQADIESFAQVIADNSTGALAFEDLQAADETVATAGVRPMVTLACLYLRSGTLFAAYNRSPERTCPDEVPVEAPTSSLGVQVPVMRNRQQLGSVYAERDLSDLRTRVTMTVGGGFVILLLAGVLAYAVAHRVNRTISEPIARLAEAAGTIQADQNVGLPAIEAGSDEVGRLVRAFNGMVDRVRQSTLTLSASNDALRREIAERRRVEAEREALLVREREASRLKDEFLAAVSHELRTPLNAILGWVQILTTTQPNAETVTRAIASIARNARTQTRVIEDLVDVSRIVTGKLHLRMEPVDLRTPVQTAADVTQPGARARNITIILDTPDHPCLVNGDVDRLQQVVWNLLSNAVKFSQPGGEVSLSLTDANGAYEITVRDAGIGIPEEFIPYVFDRFRQADGSMTREHGGLGLGLAIVKELTEMHGGGVSVASGGRGLGASFTVRLPQLVGLAPPAMPVRAGETAQLVATPLAGVSVLAVDDDADALDVLEAVLIAAGAEVRLARSGAEAIRLWQQPPPPQVLLCDLAMPGMSGFDVLREIRAHEATRGGLTHAIALTARASVGDAVRCREAGFIRHVVKPFAAGELIAAVRQAGARS